MTQAGFILEEESSSSPGEKDICYNLTNASIFDK